MTLSGTLSTPQGMSGMLSLSAGTDPTLLREGVAADAKAVGELKADIIEDTVSGPIANITDAKAGAVNSLEVAITPKQAGSGAPSPTNVRAISGWTGANVYAAGKNLLPNLKAQASAAQVNLGQSETSGEHVFLKAGTYTMRGTAIKQMSFYYRGTKDTENIRVVSIGASLSGVGTFTIAEDDWVRIWAYANGITTDDINWFQLELGSTATAYEPYIGDTTSISFGQTVYGGKLNVTTGELTVTHGYIGSYAGETLPGKWICDRAVYVAGTTPPTGAQVVYELATPTTYQLTPAEVTTLLGGNNIWADTGDVLNCEYKCDTKLYIQKLTMPAEDDMTANQNIASGKFFMIGNSLYYSTASIANGAKIIVGTNCNRVSLADALNNINS